MSPLSPTSSLLPPSSSPYLIPTLALLFEPAAAPHIHTILLHSSHHGYHHYNDYYHNYTTLIAHIRSLLLEYLLLSPPPPTNNNKGKEESLEEEGRKKKERREIIKEIVNAHPRLGSTVLLGAGRSTPTTSTTTTTTTPIIISELSTKEQAQLQSSSSLGGEEEEEIEILRVLNEEYEKRFGGLKFVTFVNGRGKGEVVGEMRERMMVRGDGGDREKEEEEEMRVAVGAVCDIAEDRVRKLGVSGGVGGD